MKTIDFGDPFYNEMYAAAVSIFGARSVTVPDVHAPSMEINDGRIFVRVVFATNETSVYFGSVPAALLAPAPYELSRQVPTVRVFDRAAALEYLTIKKAESDFLKQHEG
jgi:hypothetical protein